MGWTGTHFYKNIKTVADNIIDIACANEHYYSDRLRIEKLKRF